MSNSTNLNIRSLSSFIFCNPSSPVPADSIFPYATVQYYNYEKKKWVEADKTYGRVARFPVASIVYFTDNSEDLKVRLLWNKGIRLDDVHVFKEKSNTGADTTGMKLIYASHSKYGDVKKALENSGDFVRLWKNENIRLKFVNDELPTSYSKRVWFLKIYADTEQTDLDSLWAEVDTSTDTIEVVRRGTETAIESDFLKYFLLPPLEINIHYHYIINNYYFFYSNVRGFGIALYDY